MRENINSGAAGQPQVEGSDKGGATDAPKWADGLRKLYDSVVEEPLPDSFMDLLSKLDEPQDGNQA